MSDRKQAYDGVVRVQAVLAEARSRAVQLENKLFQEDDEELLPVIEQLVNTIESAGKAARIAKSAVAKARARAVKEAAS